MKTARFDSLEVGTKFYHEDFGSYVLEKVCGNAAVKVNIESGCLFSFYPSEIVQLVTKEVQ